MSNKKTIFVCQECGHVSLKWQGKCPECQNWNTLTEEISTKSLKPISAVGLHGQPVIPKFLDEIEQEHFQRIHTGSKEFDRVLGGGVVPGSLVLVGGDPGIGKSTLMLQTVGHVVFSGHDNTEKNHIPLLYVSGEESLSQIKMRAQRLGISPTNLNRLAFISSTHLESILANIESHKPSLVVIDSIQTMYSDSIASSPGTVSQIRHVTLEFMNRAKQTGTSFFLIGHVTKEGAIAGPKVLEHMVDTVLYFEGDRLSPYRMLRGFKNRFGSTNEVGIFSMSSDGLEEVDNPSRFFISETLENKEGSAITVNLEGTRPILVEIQALITPGYFGNPRRTAIGIDHNKAALLLAVLEKKAGLHIMQDDLFLNVIGGLKMSEPSVDLAVVAAMASSFLNKSIPSKSAVFGEVDLIGEIRAVPQAERRIEEAMQLGFERCYLPSSNLKRIEKGYKKIELIPVKTLSDFIQSVFR